MGQAYLSVPRTFARLASVQIRELEISGAFEISPQLLGDERGLFLENFRVDQLEKYIGHEFRLRQSNVSVSSKGVLRGIHFADVPTGQAKYVTCYSGAVMDFVIDIRVGSPTFGQWDSVLLDDIDRKSVYLSEGLGHAFLALEDNSTVGYLVSETFNSDAEHGIDPLDPVIGITFPFPVSELKLSEKDEKAPSLNQAQAEGLLPEFHDVQTYIKSLSDSGKQQ